MPLRNPFRRPQSDRPTLRQRVASLKAGLARVIHEPAARAPEPKAEPIPAETRAAGDAELIALAPQWESARDLYQQRSAECSELCSRVDGTGPGPAPSGPAHAQWRKQVEEWRDRTGVADAEQATDEALDALAEIEDRIAELPATSLAGLRLKARVAQRCDDIEVEWPQGLGDGLARDLLAFTGDPQPLQGGSAAALIKRHRAAYAAWEPHLDAISTQKVNSPAYHAAEKAGQSACLAESEAFVDLIEARATTLPDLAAIAAYLPEAFQLTGLSDLEDQAQRALRGLCSSVLKLLGEEADAELTGLEAEFLDADAKFTAAAVALRRGSDRYVEPPVPTALKVFSNDWIYTSIPMPKARSGRFHYHEIEIDILRSRPCVATFVGGEGELQPDGVTRVRPDSRAQARADAIVAAWDEWQTQIREARAALDLDALDAAYDAAQAVRDAVLQRVREATAQGLAGLAIKARIAANMSAVEDPKAHGLKHHDPDDNEGLFYDLAGDVLAMTGGLPDAFQAQD